MLVRSAIRGRGLYLPSGGGGGDPPPENSIPLAWDDSRYAANVAGPDVGVGNPITATTTFTNKDWDGSPSFADGDECIRNYAEGTSVVTLEQCRTRWREGPRVAMASGATLNFNECFLSAIGNDPTDHADAIQCYGTGGTVNLTNTCLRSYSDAEAKSLLGSQATGSDAFRWADFSSGSVNFTNVLVLGGGRGITINQDDSVTNIAFENVYIVSIGDGFAGSGFYKMRFDDTFGGARTFSKWINVCSATIVDGVIVPGAPIPQPDATGDWVYPG